MRSPLIHLSFFFIYFHLTFKNRTNFVLVFGLLNLKKIFVHSTLKVYIYLIPFHFYSTRVYKNKH